MNLSTKVLADMLTIDEIPRRCSNPKVERFKTEVYGQGMVGAIDFNSQPRHCPGLADTLFRGTGASFPDAVLRVQEGLVNS